MPASVSWAVSSSSTRNRRVRHTSFLHGVPGEPAKDELTHMCCPGWRGNQASPLTDSYGCAVKHRSGIPCTSPGRATGTKRSHWPFPLLIRDLHPGYLQSSIEGGRQREVNRRRIAHQLVQRPNQVNAAQFKGGMKIIRNFTVASEQPEGCLCSPRILLSHFGHLGTQKVLES